MIVIIVAFFHQDLVNLRSCTRMNKLFGKFDRIFRMVINLMPKSVANSEAYLGEELSIKLKLLSII